MGLHSIYVDDEVFAELQKRAIALKDNPNSVLREVLSIGKPEGNMVWVQDTSWRKLDEPKRCRSIGGHPKTHCPNMADFGLPRSNGVWAYCEEHMYGRRIRDGIVENKVHPDSPAAKRGYV